MKATGIVRRMDDLGRVVIPKEIRRQMKIREGDPLEIFLEGKMVCFQPYSPIDREKWEAALRVAKIMLKHTKFALLDSYNEVIGANVKTFTVGEQPSYEITVEGDVVGYIQALEDDAADVEFSQTAKILSALFAEE